MRIISLLLLLACAPVPTYIVTPQPLVTPRLVDAVAWWDTIWPPSDPPCVLLIGTLAEPRFSQAGQHPMAWPEWADSVWHTPDGQVSPRHVYLNRGAWRYGVVVHPDDGSRRLVPLWWPGPARVYDPCNYLDEIAAGLPGYPVPEGWTPQECE